ncbi:energy transducer TonB [Solimonas terrae]|uniref:TonB family protein n=1 Tax=Solimonas terrae TaxID=1396819 RepID=A0A6M2BY35_9GAMM|nr:energy transducer TonB [Solimonas terrae]NGY06789.1 TonB family protein [Solimonas terrae]
MEFGQQGQDPRRRMMGIGAVVAFHALLIWALAAGLAHKMIEILPAPIETKLIEEIKPPDEPPPPPPPPTLDVPPPFVPPPEINIQTAPSAHAITAQSRAPVAKAPPSVSKPPVVRASGCREPDYPAISERLGETGTVLLQLLVGVDGKVSASKISRSSGYDRLDKAAQQALSRCRFTPGEVAGKPAPAWAELKYTFRKQN